VSDVGDVGVDLPSIVGVRRPCLRRRIMWLKCM